MSATEKVHGPFCDDSCECKTRSNTERLAALRDQVKRLEAKLTPTPTPRPPHADLAALLTTATEISELARDYDRRERGGCDRGTIDDELAAELASWFNARLRAAALALSSEGETSITKVSDMDCYEIRYLVPKVEVHAFAGHDFAGVVGRAVADKWREAFLATREVPDVG